MAYINGKEILFSPTINHSTADGELQNKSVSITKNGNRIVTPDSGYVGISSLNVSVNVPSKDPVLQEKTVTENGVVTPDSGYDGLSKVTVNVPDTGGGEEVILQFKTVDVAENGTVVVTPDSGVVGLSSVEVNVAVPATIPEGYIKPIGGMGVSENGTYDVTQYESVTVSVPATIPEGYIKPSGSIIIGENGQYDVTEYAEVYVGVSSGVQPSGNFNITANGTYDIAQYESVTVDVPSSGGSSSNVTQAELRGGYYRNDDQNYYPLGYQYLPMNNGSGYSYSADVVGDVDDTIFASVTIEGGDGNNEAPYATAYFKNSVGDVVATFYSNETTDYRKISISNYTIVPIEFYAVFNGMFMYGVYTG